MPDFIIDSAEDPNAGEDEGYSAPTQRPANPRHTATGTQADPEQVIRQGIADAEFGVQFSQVLEEVGNNAMDLLADETASPQQKSKALVGVLAAMLPASLREVGSATPNADRSLVISRTTILAKTIGETVAAIEKAQSDQTVNPNAPRFKEAIAMFLEDVSIAFKESQPTAIQHDLFFNALADRLRGWEDRVEALNTASAAARAKKLNPNSVALMTQPREGNNDEDRPQRMN